MRFQFWLPFFLMIATVYGARHEIRQDTNINSVIQTAAAGDTLLILEHIICKESVIINKNLCIMGFSEKNASLSIMSGSYLITGENIQSIEICNIKLAAMGILMEGLIRFDNIDFLFINNVTFLDAAFQGKISNSFVKIVNSSFNYSKTKCLQLENIEGIIEKTIFDSDNNCLSINGIGNGSSFLIQECEFKNGQNFLSISDGNDGTFKIDQSLFHTTSDTIMPNSIISINNASGEICRSRFYYSGSKTMVSVLETDFVHIHHNLMYSNHFSPTTISLYTNNVDTINVINNTFYNFTQVIMSADCQLKYINNISTGPSKTAINCMGNRDAVIRYNNFYGFTNPPYEGNINLLESINNIFIDPAFVSINPEDTENFLCLQCNSPSINAGDPSYDAGMENDSIIDQGFTGGTDRGCGTAVSIHETIQEQSRCMDIFPQPANSVIHFHLHNKESVIKTKIFNLAGKKIEEWNYLPSAINSTKFPSGIYFIYIQTNGKIIKDKFTIIH